MRESSTVCSLEMCLFPSSFCHTSSSDKKEVELSSLKIEFRSSTLIFMDLANSPSVATRPNLASACGSWFNSSGSLCLAYDVETIGHHIPQYTAATLDAFVEACAERSVTLGHFSALVDRLQRREVSVSSGSWSTSLGDIAQGEYFPLWQHSRNAVHRVLAEMTSLAITAVNEGIPDEEARRSLDKGLHSCKEWWANSQRWNPDAVRSGFSLLETAAVRSRPEKAAEAEALRLRLDGLLS